MEWGCVTTNWEEKIKKKDNNKVANFSSYSFMAAGCPDFKDWPPRKTKIKKNFKKARPLEIIIGQQDLI